MPFYITYYRSITPFDDSAAAFYARIMAGLLILLCKLDFYKQVIQQMDVRLARRKQVLGLRLFRHGCSSQKKSTGLQGYYRLLLLHTRPGRLAKNLTNLNYLYIIINNNYYY
jgi:hypothetical protein